MSKKERAALFAGQEYAIHVTGRGLQVTDAMKQYAIDKIVQKVEKFTDRVVDVHINMDIQKLDHKVDITLLTHGIKIKSHATTTDMYVSIDEAVDKICSQIRRYLSRLHDHHKRTHEERVMPVSVIRPLSEAEELTALNAALEADEHERLKNSFKLHKVVKQESVPLKTLSIEEAVMKMDLSQDAFLLFKAEHNKKLHLIYRRGDGDYGLMLPEA